MYTIWTVHLDAEHMVHSITTTCETAGEAMMVLDAMKEHMPRRVHLVLAAGMKHGNIAITAWLYDHIGETWHHVKMP